MKRYRRCILFLLLFGPLSCVPSGEVKVPEQELPTAFEGSAGVGAGPSSATRRWREYFSDGPLIALIAGALEHNPDMLVGLQRIEIARAELQRTTGSRVPAVAVGAAVGLRRFGRYTMDGAGNAATDIRPGQRVPEHLPDFSLGVQASWEIDVWGKLGDRRDAAAARYLASIEGTRFVTTTLVAEVAVAYFELVALDHSRAVLEQTLERQGQALDVIRAQKEAGRANELAVQQFEAQLAGTRAQAVGVHEQAQLLENQLNLLLGRFPAHIERTRDDQLGDVGERLAAGVPSDLLRNRPDIRRAELELRAARLDVGAARAAFLPRFDISASAGYQAFDPRFLLSTPASLAYSAFAGVFAPIVNRSGIEAAFAGARAHQIQAMYRYQKAVLDGFVDVTSGLTMVERSQELLGFRRVQRAAMVDAVETADALYRAGKASYFEVLMAQQSSLAAELELIDAAKRRRLASVGLYRALGGGWM